jgi:hypothetical protein
MAYVINKYNGEQLVVLEDGTLDITTDLNLVGKNYVGYGEIQNENFVFLLENFANDTAPRRPLPGQTWFNSELKTLNLYDGSDWIPVGAVTVSRLEPTATIGAFWFKESSQQLYVYNGIEWTLIGPEALENYQTTRIVSRTVLDADNIRHPVSISLVNGIPIAIIAASNFVLNPSNGILNFNQIRAGINLSSTHELNGNVSGNSTTATFLQNAKKINGVDFDGSADIDIRSTTEFSLSAGSYINGSSFNGSSAITWNVDATPNNTIGKIVARDSGGDFSANRITANLIGNVTGNVTSTGISTFNRIEAAEFIGSTLSGNAFSASKLQNARTINGVSFDGTANITLGVDAEDLTGDRLASQIRQSNLETLGTLVEARVSDLGISIGSSSQFKLTLDTSVPTIVSDVNELDIKIGNRVVSKHISSLESLSLGGQSKPALIPGDVIGGINLGGPNRKWDNIYANIFLGTASAARYADLAEKYTADGDYEPGTVVMFGGDKEITLAEKNTRKVAGVISLNPAYLMNADLHDTNTAIVALQGRVRVFVTGEIKKGDMLISAGGGIAMSAENPQSGSVIGKALEDFSGVDGIIEIVVGRM